MASHQKRKTRLTSEQIAARAKQVELGKATLGYQLYRQQVPIGERQVKLHPGTPNPCRKCSKRSWDGQIRAWRRALHKYDPSDYCSDDDSAMLLIKSVVDCCIK